MQDLLTHVEELARTAAMHAQQHFDVRLDFSPQSIEEVESVLGKLFDKIPHTKLARVFKRKPDFTDVARIANAYGAYVGEVIRREYGGSWEETEVCGCENILMLRIAGDFTLLPTTKTWNRLTMGPSENIVNYYRKTEKRAASLKISNQRSNGSAVGAGASQ